LTASDEDCHGLETRGATGDVEDLSADLERIESDEGERGFGSERVAESNESDDAILDLDVLLTWSLADGRVRGLYSEGKSENCSD
jgi:hypothetical protein